MRRVRMPVAIAIRVVPILSGLLRSDDRLESLQRLLEALR